jgi:hypothetical protein
MKIHSSVAARAAVFWRAVTSDPPWMSRRRLGILEGGGLMASAASALPAAANLEHFKPANDCFFCQEPELMFVLPPNESPMKSMESRSA